MAALQLKIVNEYGNEIMGTDDLGVIGETIAKIANQDPRTQEINKLKVELKEMTAARDNQKYWADSRAKELEKMKKEAAL